MTKANKIRVLIADDHDMLREGLVAFLRFSRDIEMVGEACNGREAIHLCRELKPDVVLMDMIMPDIDGVTAINTIHQESPQIAFIALTSSHDENLFKRAMQAGATSFLMKNIPAQRLADAIRATHAGLAIVAPEISVSFNSTNERSVVPVGNELTQREHDVLAQMVSGLPNAEIAKVLGISTSTVKNHVSSILLKMGVSSRMEAVVGSLKRQLPP